MRSGGGGRGGVWRVAIRGAVCVQVCQLHGRSDIWLVAVVFLQVACQRAVVAATVRAMLPPVHSGAAGAADVYVDVIVYVGCWGH